MSNFKEGEKIVCIRPGEASLGLEKDKLYTCLASFNSNMEESVVEVLEAMPPEPYHGYQASRFRKAIPKDMKKLEETEALTI